MTRRRWLLGLLALSIAGASPWIGTALGQGAGSGGGGDDIETIVDLVPNAAKPAFRPGATLKACTGTDVDNANAWIEYSWAAAPLEHNPTGETQFNQSVRMPVDDEQCVTLVGLEDPQATENLANGTPTWQNLSDCFCLNHTGRWSVYLEATGDLGTTGGFVFENFTVTDTNPILHSQSTITGFETFDARLVEFAIFGIFLLAWWHGWLLTGVIFLVVGLGTQLDAAFLEGWTYRAAYTLGILSIGFEILVWDNPIYKRVRKRLSTSSQ